MQPTAAGLVVQPTADKMGYVVMLYNQEDASQVYVTSSFLPKTVKSKFLYDLNHTHKRKWGETSAVPARSRLGKQIQEFAKQVPRNKWQLRILQEQACESRQQLRTLEREWLHKLQEEAEVVLLNKKDVFIS